MSPTQTENNQLHVQPKSLDPDSGQVCDRMVQHLQLSSSHPWDGSHIIPGRSATSKQFIRQSHTSFQLLILSGLWRRSGDEIMERSFQLILHLEIMATAISKLHQLYLLFRGSSMECLGCETQFRPWIPTTFRRGWRRPQ